MGQLLRNRRVGCGRPDRIAVRRHNAYCREATSRCGEGRRMRKQAAYEPEFEDWLFHVVLPLAAYAILALSSFAAPSHTREALFGVGGAALLLLFTGIHNAWDSVAYHVLVTKADTNTARPRDETK